MKNQKLATLGLGLTTVLAGVVMAHDDDDLSVIPPGTNTFAVNTNTNPVLHGKVGPLIVMHAMGVHNSMTWKTNDDHMPKLLLFHRHAAYRADEVANPDIVNFLIANKDPVTGLTAFSNRTNQFNSAFRRTFQQLCYGGYTIIHDVSQSVPNRIKVDQNIEISQLWDTAHPDAFNIVFNNPKFSPAALNNSDGETNFASWKNMGHSRGLHYDMYCPGFSTLENGRTIFPGGHDMNSQNGSYRIQVFDPDGEVWIDRPVSCMRTQFGSDPNDPYQEKWFQAQKDLGRAERDIYLPIGNSLTNDCNPHALALNLYSTNYPRIRLMGPDGTVTHPGRMPGDMRYARWYPVSVSIPGNKAFIYAGWDRDESFGPNQNAPSPTSMALTNFFNSTNYTLPANWKLAGFLASGGDASFLASKIVQPVPEVYDGTTDTVVTLENCRLYHSAWYPNGLLVQTGRSETNWAVVVLDGDLFENVAEIGGEKAPTRDRDFTKTWMVDIQGAMADPDRNEPQVRAGKHIKYLDKSTISHSPFSANSNLMEIDEEGNVVSHKLYHFGGVNNTAVGGSSDVAEVLDLTPLSKERAPGAPPKAMPKWSVLPGKLYQRARQNYATPLPDGKIVIMGGNGGSLPGIEAWSLHLQIFDPATGLITKVDKTAVPRDEHGIIQLFPDGRVYLSGQNRNGIVPSGDPTAPAGDADLGVNCGQFYSPPYLFDNQTNAAVRPVITMSPKQIDYGVDFNMAVDASDDIAEVVMIRTGSMSHSLNTDLRRVKVPFSKTSDTLLRVTAPVLPGTALGGYYMLFAVDSKGVPSIAKKVVLGDQVQKKVAWM